MHDSQRGPSAEVTVKIWIQYIFSYFNFMKELGQMTHVFHGTPNSRVNDGYYYGLEAAQVDVPCFSLDIF